MAELRHGAARSVVLNVRRPRREGPGPRSEGESRGANRSRRFSPVYRVRMSGASSRAKGQRAEREVVHALRRAGWAAMTSRAVLGGTQRGADIVSDFPAVIEVKDQAKLDLAGWLRQAQDAAGGDPAVVVHKRRGVGDAEGWYVTTDLRTLLRLVAAVGEQGGTDGVQADSPRSP